VNHRDPQQKVHCVCNTPCECGRNYVGETGRLLVVWLREHRQNIKQRYRATSKYVQYAFKGHQQCWNEVTSFRQSSTAAAGNIRSPRIWRLENTISQPSFDFLPILIPLTSKEVNKQHGMTMDSGITHIYCIYTNARQL